MISSGKEGQVSATTRFAAVIENPTAFGGQTLEVISDRRCCRSFSQREVPLELIERILLAARNVPSSQNTQPWGVCVITGESLTSLSARLLESFESTPASEIKPDYRNRPSELPPAEQDRLADYGKTYYDFLKIQREDAAARRGIDRRNYTFFGAPVHLILHTTKRAVEGTFLDCGIFLATILHAAAAFGLGACPQFSIAKFADTVREHLGIAEDRLIICGISIGYAGDAEINYYKPKRAPLSESVTWHGATQPSSKM